MLVNGRVKRVDRVGGIVRAPAVPPVLSVEPRVADACGRPADGAKSAETRGATRPADHPGTADTLPRRGHLAQRPRRCRRCRKSCCHSRTRVRTALCTSLDGLGKWPRRRLRRSTVRRGRRSTHLPRTCRPRIPRTPWLPTPSQATVPSGGRPVRRHPLVGHWTLVRSIRFRPLIPSQRSRGPRLGVARIRSAARQHCRSKPRVPSALPSAIWRPQRDRSAPARGACARCLSRCLCCFADETSSSAPKLRPGKLFA